LRSDNGPYTVIAWTYHAELLEKFEKSVFSEKDVPKPILSLMLTKTQCKSEDGEFSLSVVSEKLAEALGQFSPVLFLQGWEQKCFLAATEVTNGLSALVAPQTKDRTKFRESWKKHFLQLLHAMASAQAYRHLDPDTCLSAVYGSLGPLYADRMESHAADLSAALVQSSEEILRASADCGNDRKARVNTLLHLAFEGLQRFTGGNLYVFPNKKRPQWLPDSRRLIEDFIQGKKGHPETAAKATQLEGVTIPVLVEIGANCDHAQKNIRVARLIFGVALPSGERNKINPRAEFIWEIGPIFLKGKRRAPEKYNIYLSARHLVSLGLDKAEEMKPYARFRSQALVDLQAWFARHASRQGMVLLRQS